MLAKQNIKQVFFILGIWLGICPLSVHAQLQAWGDYPSLPKQAVTVQTEVAADQYRFLESLSDTQVRAWMKKQTDFSNAVLARISGRDALLKRLKVLQSTEFGAGRLIEVRGMQFFTRTTADNRQQLFMRSAATNAERLLLLTEPGQGISFFTPSLDGSHVAVHLLNSGRQRHSLRIIKTNDASMLKDNLDTIAPDSKEIAWKPDSTTIYYRKSSAKPGSDRGAIWQHVLGSKLETDVPLIGPGVSKSRRFTVSDVVVIKSSQNSSYLLAEVQHGQSQDRSLYLVKLDQIKGATTGWQRLASPTDKLKNAWLTGEQLYLLSAKKKSTGAILKLDLKTPQLNTAKEVLSASSDELLDIAVAKNALYVHVAEAGYSKLIKAELDGSKKEELTLPYSGRISELNTDADTDGALFVLEAANAAPLSYRALAGGQIRNVEVFRSPQVGFHRIASKNLSITKPGSNKQIALTLLYPQGMELDSKHPLLLTMETGTGLSKLAKFDALRLAWLEQDAVMAIVYVPADERLKQKNASDGLDEFLTAADYLVSEGYTSSGRLVTQESGPGKRWLAQAISQRPELFAAIQSAALQSELLNAGNSKKRTATDRGRLVNSNPYLSLRDGQSYPAALISARFGVADTPIWMSSKFVARLQAANVNKSRPALFRTDFANGWKYDALAEQADNWAFLLWQTGQKGFSVLP
ncbi:MAG: S9 family peptidase [Burkholderiales bacterium]|nr:S9 family peptidase [Burkholderiales bacterium]MBI3730789.1 S9 family peptidase [Burkholderiales bacterium]